MNYDTVKLAVFGTLRKTGVNHARWLSDSTYLGKTKLYGFCLKHLRWPLIVQSPVSNDRVVVEVYETPAANFLDIKAMELGCGIYTLACVETDSHGFAMTFVTCPRMARELGANYVHSRYEGDYIKFLEGVNSKDYQSYM